MGGKSEVSLLDIFRSAIMELYKSKDGQVEFPKIDDAGSGRHSPDVSVLGYNSCTQTKILKED